MNGDARAATLQTEVFSCERARPFMGWSMDYLSGLEKGPFRVRGAKESWSTMEDAEKALLAPGFRWEDPAGVSGNGGAKAENWMPDPSGQEADAENWSYAGNFPGNYKGSSSSKGSWARWKRLVRLQVFDGTSEALGEAAPKVGGTVPEAPFCPNYDIAGAASVGRRIMEAIATATLHGEWSDHALVLLKTEMLRRLTVQDKAESKDATEEAKEEGQEEDPQAEEAAKAANTFESMIVDFVNAHKSGTALLVEGILGADDISLDLSSRIEKVVEKFSAEEREAYAVLAIRRFHLQWGCKATPEKPCGECPLRPVFCPNAGCAERLSAYSLEQHDKFCPRKLILCEDCKADVPRGDLQQHKRDTCPERIVCCLYKSIACPYSMKPYRMDAHLKDHQDAHLKAMCRTVNDQQELIEQGVIQLDRLEALAAAQFRQIGEENQILEQVKAQMAAIEQNLSTVEGTTDAAARKIYNDSWWDARRKTNTVNDEVIYQCRYLRNDLNKLGVPAMIAEVAQLNMKATLRAREKMGG